MATHHDDEEQLDNLKRWFSENWMALAAGLVIGFGAIGGWQGWKAYHEKQYLAASQMYTDLKKALEASKPAEAAGIADKLQADYPGTPYATVAALRLAQVAVIDNKLDDAAKRLDWVVANGDDDSLKQLAKVRKARVLWQQGKADEALKAVEGEGGEFASLAAELRGDIQQAKGDRDAARSAYEAALKAAPENAANRALLQQKLDDLAVETAAAEPAAAPAAAEAVKP